MIWFCKRKRLLANSIRVLRETGQSAKKKICFMRTCLCENKMRREFTLGLFNNELSELIIKTE